MDPPAGPESPWTDLLCARITEFLRAYPAEWVCFDPFTYGMLGANNFRVPPAWFVKKPFREIIGREMPDDAAKITLEESRLYMREVLGRQFHRIQEAIHEGSPDTKSFYNVPFYVPNEPLWVNHPMLNECDMLSTESSDRVGVLALAHPQAAPAGDDDHHRPAGRQRGVRSELVAALVRGRMRLLRICVGDSARFPPASPVRQGSGDHPQGISRDGMTLTASATCPPFKFRQPNPGLERRIKRRGRS